MPTLSACGSIFQLAFGVNAVLPAVLADYEDVRAQAAESLLRKIKETRPDFKLKERDRLDFVDFTFRSTAGLRHAKFVTQVIGWFSVLFSAVSLWALYRSAMDPNRNISARQLLVFVSATLIVAPIVYVARNRYLKWIQRILVVYGSNDPRENQLFIDCVDIYLRAKKDSERLDQAISEAVSDLPFIIWKIRLHRFEMWLMGLNYKIKMLWYRLSKK